MLPGCIAEERVYTVKTIGKKILFLTGTRADFGKIKTLIEEVERSVEFEALIFATGMHMLARYGSTVNKIEKLDSSRYFRILIKMALLAPKWT